MQVLLTNFLDYLKSERLYSAHTVLSYRNDISQFIQYLESEFFQKNVPPARIEGNHIREFVDHLYMEGLQKRSIARKLSAIKSFFKYLQRRKLIKKNPAYGLTAPKLDKPLPVILNEKEARRVMELPDENTFEGIRDRAILELFYGCGIRLSELIHLRMKQIFLARNFIIVLGKRKRERIVPLGEMAKGALKNYLDKRNETVPQFKNPDIVFVNKKGKPLYPLAVQKMVKTYLSKVSEQHHLSPHVLRHTFATHLLDHGADLLVVKELLGHESLSSTQIYTHVSLERLKNVYEQSHPRSKRDS
ncbi:MAG: tyrosine recombinase XerC [Calditrichia bacterium]